MSEKKGIVHVAFFKDEKLVRLEEEVQTFLRHKQTKEEPLMQIIKQYRHRVAFERTLKPISPKFSDYHFSNSEINKFLKDKGIKLYSHQVKGIEKVKEGKNIVITTPTASGKSFVYILSVLERLKENPFTKALVVFPLKALARDQYGKILDVINDTGINATVKVYDGDTDKEERREIKSNPPTFLITTPDMLNAGILPYHESWSYFFENLDFIVLDEIHAYRGILGSHVSNILRRLKRIISYYRSKKPVFIMNSATIHNPTGFASKLTGEEVFEISENGAGSPEREIKIFRQFKSLEIAEFIADLVENDVSTIVFVDSRKETEILTLRVRNILSLKKGERLSLK